MAHIVVVPPGRQLADPRPELASAQRRAAIGHSAEHNAKVLEAKLKTEATPPSKRGSAKKPTQSTAKNETGAIGNNVVSMPAVHKPQSEKGSVALARARNFMDRIRELLAKAPDYAIESAAARYWVTRSRLSPRPQQPRPTVHRGDLRCSST